MKFKMLLAVGVLCVCVVQAHAAKESCIDCHGKDNPKLVVDWESSAMAKKGMGCVDCHGTEHDGPTNVEKSVLPTIKQCSKCHEKQASQFMLGKHARAEEALSIPPMGKKVNKQAPVVFRRACATCHQEICKGGGQCDACHSRHRFSAEEARKPEACLPCHMGNHPQYEAYGFSKHGALYKSRGLDDAVPTCATCHMSKGDHMVKTSWGFFGIRGEEPDKKQAAIQKKVKKSLSMLGPVLAPDSFRPDMAQWNERREAMLDICADCHSRSHAKGHLEEGDKVVTQANKMASGLIFAADELKAMGELNQKEYFWLIRDKMHAQRMGMYINAFHQNPEGVLLDFIHFKRETMALKKSIQQKKEKK